MGGVVHQLLGEGARLQRGDEGGVVHPGILYGRGRNRPKGGVPATFTSQSPSTFTSTPTSCRVQAMRLLELQCEADARQACAAIGREVADANLRGWAALLAEGVLAEGMRQSGLPVLQGARGALVLGSIAQIWLAARSLADALERESLREAARELMRRGGHAGGPAPGGGGGAPPSRPPADRPGGVGG